MVDFTGTWRNQHGSMLELHVIGGIISGRFESGVGDDDQTLWVKINGQAFGDVIAFTAVYPQYETVVAWVGQHTTEAGQGKIKALWLHSTNVENADELAWMWYSNRIGADVFTRV